MNPSEINTSIPCEIVAFNPETQLAQVQISIKAKHHDTVTPVTRLNDVPVEFPNVLGYLLTFPIKTDPPCPARLVFMQRSIDQWYTSGGVVDPQDNRTHDLSDAICIPGLRSSRHIISNFNNDHVELRSEDGLTRVTLSDEGRISLRNEKEELLQILSEALQLLSSDQAVVTSGSSSGSWDIKHQSDYAALKTRLDTLKLA